MRIATRPRPFNLRLKTIAIITLIITVAYTIWFYNYSADQEYQLSHLKQTTTVKQTPKPIQPKIPPPPQQPVEKFMPDYSIPPIENGMVPVITNFNTAQNIVFLSIDDGAFKDKSVVDLLNKYKIKASLFLSSAFISDNPDFFKQLTTQGSIIENHTISHDINMVKNQTYQQQKNEICGMADYEQEHFGVRPTLYRPPGGAYSNVMRQAAADCGMKAIVTWIAKANGGSMQYQIGDRLRPGDIVLMHFRPEFEKDLQAFVEAEKAAGLHTELIENAI